MRVLARLALIATCLTLLPFPHSAGAAPGRGVVLSQHDRQIGAAASRLAASNPGRAARWLRRQNGVAGISLGADHAMLDVRFRDGAELLILPRATRAIHLHPGRHILVPAIRPFQHASDSPPPRAAILLPFESELHNEAQDEVNALQKAGFHVDVFLNKNVSVDLMQQLGIYSVIYEETHSGTLSNGDAIIVTASTDASKYAAFLPGYPGQKNPGDGTVRQATIAGEDGLFLAITGDFIRLHMQTFTASSMIYLDGCDILHADYFWKAVQSRGVAAMVTWDNHVFSYSSELAASMMFSGLASGESVAASLKDTTDAGLAVGLGDNGAAHLGARGDLDDSLAKVFEQATPTPTPTDTPTPGPTATSTPTPVKKVVKCKKGYKKVHGKCKKVKKKK